MTKIKNSTYGFNSRLGKIENMISALKDRSVDNNQKKEWIEKG